MTTAREIVTEDLPPTPAFLVTLAAMLFFVGLHPRLNRSLLICLEWRWDSGSAPGYRMTMAEHTDTRIVGVSF